MIKVRNVLARFLAVLVATSVAGSSVASAQDARAAQQVKLRQSAYTVLGAQMGLMGAMASGKAPYDANTFRVAAERASAIVVERLSPSCAIRRLGFGGVSSRMIRWISAIAALRMVRASKGTSPASSSYSITPRL